MDATETLESGAGLTFTPTADGHVVWVKLCGEVDLARREVLRVSLARLEFGEARLVFSRCWAVDVPRRSRLPHACPLPEEARHSGVRRAVHSRLADHPQGHGPHQRGVEFMKSGSSSAWARWTREGTGLDTGLTEIG